jgi:hypothetical protein
MLISNQVRICSIEGETIETGDSYGLDPEGNVVCGACMPPEEDLEDDCDDGAYFDYADYGYEWDD